MEHPGLRKQSVVRLLLPYVYIISLIFAVYANTIGFEFLYLDDDKIILNNSVFLGSLKNLPALFQEDVFRADPTGDSYYRPLYSLSFMLDAQWGGIRPWVYNLTNVALHAVVSCLLFAMLIKLGTARDVSFILSLLFAAHPLAVQNVCWIPGRNDMLLAIFSLASFSFFISLLRDGKKRHYLGHLAFFVCALLVKESALFLIPVCIAYAFASRNSSESVTPRTSNLSEILTQRACGVEWLVIVAGWWVMRAQVVDASMLPSLHTTGLLFSRIPWVLQITGKALLPFNLAPLPTMEDSTILYGIATIVITTAAVMFSKHSRDSRSLVLIGALWYAGALLPVFSLGYRSSDVALMEHRMYVPLIGFFILWSTTAAARNLSQRPYARTTALIVLATFLVLTIAHSGHFRSRRSFWLAAVQKSPNSPLAHLNLGAMLETTSYEIKAEQEYLEALRLGAVARASMNLGLLRSRQGRLTEAETDLKKALVHNPRLDAAYFGLAALYKAQARHAEAAAMMAKLQELNPEFLKIHKPAFSPLPPGQ